jgi:hypothetical protein
MVLLSLHRPRLDSAIQSAFRSHLRDMFNQDVSQSLNYKISPPETRDDVSARWRKACSLKCGVSLRVGGMMEEGQLEMPTQGRAGSSGLTGGDRALV